MRRFLNYHIGEQMIHSLLDQIFFLYLKEFNSIKPLNISTYIYHIPLQLYANHSCVTHDLVSVNKGKIVCQHDSNKHSCSKTDIMTYLSELSDPCFMWMGFFSSVNGGFVVCKEGSGKHSCFTTGLNWNTVVGYTTEQQYTSLEKYGVSKYRTVIM